MSKHFSFGRVEPTTLPDQRTPSGARCAIALAGSVVLEARRSGLFLLVLAAMATGVGFAAFVSQVAITEGANLQTGVLASIFRIVAVFLTAAFVVSSMVREASDKGIELLLSLPISRTTYYLGKLGGFTACGAIFALAFSTLLIFWSTPLAVAAWGMSLILETWLVAAVSLFFVMALGQVVPALAAVGATYLLGRVLASIQAVSASPLSGEETFVQQMARGAVDLVALLLPSLDKATQTVWLLYSPPSLFDFLAIAASLCLYVALIVSAGLFDFHRRNL